MKIKSYQPINSRTDFFYYMFRNILLVGFPLTFISALLLSSIHSSAAELSSADSVSLSIPTACTLSNEINDNHSTSIINGRYVQDIGKTTITTYCNDENGYVVYAAGYSNNELGNTKLISDRSTGLNNFDILTGTATSGDNSAWAMKLSTTNVGNLGGEPGSEEYGYITNNDGDIVQTNQGDDTPTIISPYNEYSAVPSQWTPVISKPSETVASTTGSSFSTTYAAYVSNTQPSGNYNGKVRYLLAHPYTGPTTLYMQDVATWKDSLNTHDTVLALDKRDYKAYWVTKLKDGHIWMTENLAIDLSYVDGAGNTVTRTFTSNDTDLNVIYDESTGSYAEYGGDGYTENNGVISWTPKDTAITSTIRGTSAPNWTNSTIYPYSAKKEDGPSSGHESLGNYYNWTAAIASNDSTSKNSSTISSIANNPKNSICPKGWRLPTISNQASTLPGSTNEFGRLNQLYNDGLTSGTGSGTKLMESPLWFVRSGNVNGTSLDNYWSNGNYWSSTVYNSNYAYRLNFSADSVNPANYDSDRNRGRSVRCVAQQPPVSAFSCNSFTKKD